MEDYEYVSTLGEGAYGFVWKCKQRAAGRLVAIKGFKQAHEEPEIMRLAVREIRVLQTLQHPAIIQLIDAFRSKSGRVYIVFPYIGRSGFQELDEYPDGLPGHRLKLLVWQVLQALVYLHKRKIVHRDIKPANILLADDSDEVKLCDFGFARNTHSGPRDVEELSSYVVTRWYRSPEVLVGDLYGPSADIWSLGCTAAELANGQPLFPGKCTGEQLWRIMRCLGTLTSSQSSRLSSNPQLARVRVPVRGRPLHERLQGSDPALLRLLEACLQVDPRKRPTAAELLQSPYFWSVPRLLAGNPLEQVYGSLLQQQAKSHVQVHQQQHHHHSRDKESPVCQLRRAATLRLATPSPPTATKPASGSGRLPGRPKRGTEPQLQSVETSSVNNTPRHQHQQPRQQQQHQQQQPRPERAAPRITALPRPSIEQHEPDSEEQEDSEQGDSSNSSLLPMSLGEEGGRRRKAERRHPGTPGVGGLLLPAQHQQQARQQQAQQRGDTIATGQRVSMPVQQLSGTGGGAAAAVATHNGPSTVAAGNSSWDAVSAPVRQANDSGARTSMASIGSRPLMSPPLFSSGLLNSRTPYGADLGGTSSNLSTAHDILLMSSSTAAATRLAECDTMQFADCNAAPPDQLARQRAGPPAPNPCCVKGGGVAEFQSTFAAAMSTMDLDDILPGNAMPMAMQPPMSYIGSQSFLLGCTAQGEGQNGGGRNPDSMLFSSEDSGFVVQDMTSGSRLVPSLSGSDGEPHDGFQEDSAAGASSGRPQRSASRTVPALSVAAVAASSTTPFNALVASAAKAAAAETMPTIMSVMGEDSLLVIDEDTTMPCAMTASPSLPPQRPGTGGRNGSHNGERRATAEGLVKRMDRTMNRMMMSADIQSMAASRKIQPPLSGSISTVSAASLPQPISHLQQQLQQQQQGASQTMTTGGSQEPNRRLIGVLSRASSLLVRAASDVASGSTAQGRGTIGSIGSSTNNSNAGGGRCASRQPPPNYSSTGGGGGVTLPRLVPSATLGSGVMSPRETEPTDAGAVGMAWLPSPQGPYSARGKSREHSATRRGTTTSGAPDGDYGTTTTTSSNNNNNNSLGVKAITVLPAVGAPPSAATGDPKGDSFAGRISYIVGSSSVSGSGAASKPGGGGGGQGSIRRTLSFINGRVTPTRSVTSLGLQAVTMVAPAAPPAMAVTPSRSRLSTRVSSVELGCALGTLVRDSIGSPMQMLQVRDPAATAAAAGQQLLVSPRVSVTAGLPAVLAADDSVRGGGGGSCRERWPSSSMEPRYMGRRTTSGTLMAAGSDPGQSPLAPAATDAPGAPAKKKGIFKKMVKAFKKAFVVGDMQ